MQQVPLENASPGMILARSIPLPDGAVLLGEGQELSASAIEKIRAAGVDAVWVEGNPLEPDEEVGNLHNVAASLPHLFRWHSENAFMMTLRNIFVRHFTTRLAVQEAQEKDVAKRAKRKVSGNSETKASGDSGTQV